MFFFRINLKFPTENTVRQFYNNFNYGLYMSQQMRTALHMQPVVQQRNLNVEQTIYNIQQLLVQQLPISWIRACAQSPARNFHNEQMTVKLTQLISTSFKARNSWLEKNAPGILVDLRRPVADEAWEQMIFSDSEAEVDLDQSDDENEDFCNEIE
jgi:hypothetical protein